MKALSIIGIVAGIISVLVSIGVINIKCYAEWGSSYPGIELGGISLVTSLYFLAFSIIATVVAFKKKKATSETKIELA